jgi:hypothetical protein
MDGEQQAGNPAGGRRARILERLAQRQGAQGAGPAGGRLGQGRLGRWQGQGGRGGRLEAFLRRRQGDQGQGPLGGFLRQRRVRGGANQVEGDERELLMRRAERLEKLLEETYEQLEKLEASATRPDQDILEIQAEDVQDAATGDAGKVTGKE